MIEVANSRRDDRVMFQVALHLSCQRPRGQHHRYPGDTLSGIGAKLGIPWRDIYNANHIEPGWVLTLP